jgi:glyceraldehyde-3-phosphate dehydrogenase/erythrose-4-phosphate dehydrogenase
MSIKVAINGLGRIGRAILKLTVDDPAFELVAVNDLVEVDNLAYLLRFDTVYGRYAKTVSVERGDLHIAGRRLRTLKDRDPLELPWKALGVELVFECTGALATTRALPEYVGLFDGTAIRAPIPVGSIADLTFLASRRTTVDEVNQILSEEAQSRRYAGVLGVSRDPLVSSDIVGDPRASIVDLELTKVIDGDLVKIMSWYDNEWGYANQMLREARTLTGRR